MSERMREAWDRRARKDAYYYVETAHWDGDVEAFFALGEERAQAFVDPVLDVLPRAAAECDALDLGCGVGRFSRALAKRFRDVLGVDVSDEMVRRARGAHPPADFPNLRFEAGDGLALPAEDDSRDFVFSYEVIQHMPSESVIRANLREAARVLRRDGVALLHVKTQQDLSGVKGLVARVLPDRAITAAKRVTGSDELLGDASFRGTAVPRERLAELFGGAGLEIREVREDPTHEPGTRVFVVAEV